MSESQLLVERRGAVQWITINRPEVRNAVAALPQPRRLLPSACGWPTGSGGQHGALPANGF